MQSAPITLFVLIERYKSRKVALLVTSAIFRRVLILPAPMAIFAGLQINIAITIYQENRLLYV